MNSYSLLAREIALQCNWQIFLSSYQYQQIKSINKEMIIASSSETRFECLQTQIPMQSHLGCLLIALIRIFVYYIDSFRFDWSASKQCVMQFQIYFLIKSMLTHKDHQHWCGQILMPNRWLPMKITSSVLLAVSEFFRCQTPWCSHWVLHIYILFKKLKQSEFQKYPVSMRQWQYISGSPTNTQYLGIGNS